MGTLSKIGSGGQRCLFGKWGKAMTRFNVVVVAFLGLTSAAASGAVIQDFVVYGKEGVTFGVGSTVTGTVGSGIDLALNGSVNVIGNAIAGDDVSLGNNAHIMGMVTNPDKLTLGSNSSVGSRTIGTPSQPGLPAATVFMSGGTDKSVGNGGILTLAPGSWGEVSLGGAATLNLSAGDYYFDELSSGNGLNLNIALNGGDTRIFVTGRVNFGGVDVNLTGGSAGDVYLETHYSGNQDAFKAGGGTDWRGLVYAPYGDINIGSGSGPGSFMGPLWAGGEVTIQHGITGSVPEPATLALVAIGALALRSRRGKAWSP